MPFDIYSISSNSNPICVQVEKLIILWDCHRANIRLAVLRFFLCNLGLLFINFLVFNATFSFSDSPAQDTANMPRTYKKQNILSFDREAVEKAFNYRIETGCSLRLAAAKFGVKPSTLQVGYA